MRLWHKDLISVLPRKQLLAQWRECCSIISSISKDGTPNHLLVNKVLNYSVYDFERYTYLIMDEIKRRGYKTMAKSYVNFLHNLNNSGIYFRPVSKVENRFELYKDWHNKRYLTQCYHNLEEKYDCGMFTEEEWSKVEKQYRLLVKEE